MIRNRSDGSPPPPAREDACPPLVGRFGSLDAFWRLIEPVLTHLQPRRICEVGVEKGIFTNRLLAWGRANGCAYVGIDPAPESTATERIQAAPASQLERAADQLLTARSVEVLPELERCDVYFLDGDHNYHTVRNELEMIQRAPARPLENAAAPIIFAHDVSWPFARRDMYHQPAAIPPEERHPCSDHLGVSLETDELIEGGLRAPGQYSIARHAGGPRNGVLTAVEDFLASEAGRGWRAIVIPIAYGLAILYRPDDRALPVRCRDHLNDLHAALKVTGKFLESCEANFLQLYLYSEDANYRLQEQTRAIRDEQSAHYRSLEAYRALEGAYGELQSAYKELESVYQRLDEIHQNASIYNQAAMREYHHLQVTHTTLENEYQNLRRRCDALQTQVDQLALSHVPPSENDGAAPSAPVQLPPEVAPAHEPTRCPLP